MASIFAAVLSRDSCTHTNHNPLWQGPCANDPLGGITQSMLARFLSCRERFRLRYVLGLEPYTQWNHRTGYGDMWHICEEALAAGKDIDQIHAPLDNYIVDLLDKYPLQREEITKWYDVCNVQFPEYIKFWSEHQDVVNRKPLVQEYVFDVPYTLPSGRTVRLRGKFDSVDMIKDHITGPSGGIYLQENKTKGDINKTQVERQLRFDLQTMMYLVALQHIKNKDIGTAPIMGIRYNVIRRPLSGGKGNIKPHSEKRYKTKCIPAETNEAFYERLRRDYIADEPDYWFFRVRAEVGDRDVRIFRETCLDPLLETLCAWYEEVTGNVEKDIRTISEQHDLYQRIDKYPRPPMNYRTPFGVFSALEEGGSTEYDHYLETGSEAGLRRTDTLFKELQ